MNKTNKPEVIEIPKKYETIIKKYYLRLKKKKDNKLYHFRIRRSNCILCYIYIDETISKPDCCRACPFYKARVKDREITGFNFYPCSSWLAKVAVFEELGSMMNIIPFEKYKLDEYIKSLKAINKYIKFV
jgi:hypothetical protein